MWRPNIFCLPGASPVPVRFCVDERFCQRSSVPHGGRPSSCTPKRQVDPRDESNSVAVRCLPVSHSSKHLCSCRLSHDGVTCVWGCAVHLFQTAGKISPAGRRSCWEDLRVYYRDNPSVTPGPPKAAEKGGTPIKKSAESFVAAACLRAGQGRLRGEAVEGTFAPWQAAHSTGVGL